MALDEANHRLIVVCRTPARMVVLDTATGKVIASIPTVGDCDDVFYDQTRKRIYATGGEGAISHSAAGRGSLQRVRENRDRQRRANGIVFPGTRPALCPEALHQLLYACEIWLAQSLVQRRHILKELVQAGRSHHDQYVEVLESVRGAAWSERRTPRAPGEALPVHLPGEISVEHVEPLILPRVAVQGGPASLGTPLPGHPCLYIP